MKLEYKKYDVDFSELVYMIDSESGQTCFLILPKGKTVNFDTHREWLKIPELVKIGMDQKAWYVGNLCHLSIKDIPQSKGAGCTLKHGEATKRLRFIKQEVERTDELLVIVTTMEAEEGYGIKHRVYYYTGETGIEVETEFYNYTGESVELEMITSVSLDNLSPYLEEDNNGQMYLHRFYGGWSLEGKHKVESFEELNLERSWSCAFPEGERFGSIGSYPVQRYFPMSIIEDRKNKVFWGIQLACGSSWQMEVTRDSDFYSFSAGIADCEFGSWFKKVENNTSFTTPKAFVSLGKETVRDVCANILTMHHKYVDRQPKKEQDLPIIFNEWCATWGEPTHEKVISYAKKLKGLPVQYIVIDAGWTASKEHSFGQVGNGDWEYSKEKFPQGIRAVSKELKKMGFDLGIWFEFEVTTLGAKVFEKKYDSLHLKRHGTVIDTGNGRTFWDFRKIETIQYLTEKVALFIQENEIKYLKIDYNASVGIGCDGAESLGEGLRQQIEAVQKFILKIREINPELVIENCASGGHRLEASFMDITSLSSFSDAHMGREIPCIAANLQNLILARQNQVWAVIEEKLSIKEIRYRLCSVFLGRFCLSGDINGLSEEKWGLVKSAIYLYTNIKECIKYGEAEVIRSGFCNTFHPQGIQAVIRRSKDKRKILLAIHSFEKAKHVKLKLDKIEVGHWKVESHFCDVIPLHEEEGSYVIKEMDDFEGAIIILQEV